MSKLPDLSPHQALTLRLIYNAEDRATYGSVANNLDVKYWRATQIVRSLIGWGLVRVTHPGGGPGNYRRFTYTDDGAAFLINRDRLQEQHKPAGGAGGPSDDEAISALEMEMDEIGSTALGEREASDVFPEPTRPTASSEGHSHD